jgi:hypothetical protein
MTLRPPPAFLRALAAGACAALLASLAAGPAAAAPPRYEATIMPGVGNMVAGLFRINVATGQTMVAWGAGTQFVALVDSAPIPPGEYHLQASSWVVDGKAQWDIYRTDAVTGRAWNGLGGGGAPIVWNEIVAPK